MLKKYKIGELFIIIFIFLFIITSLYYFDKYITEKLESQLIVSLKDISNQNVKLIENEINNRFNLLSSLAKEFGDYTEEEVSKSSTYTNLLSNRFNFRKIGIALPNGTAYMSSGGVVDLTEREYFKESMKGNNWVSETLISKEDGGEVNIYSVPIINSDFSINGVFFTTHDTEDFSKLLQVNSFDGNGYSYIINSKGDILNINSELYYGEKNLFDKLMNQSNFAYKDINNEAINSIKKALNSDEKEGSTIYWYDNYKYVVYEKLEINDWWLVTVVPDEILTNRIKPIIIAIHYICIFVFLLSVIMIFIDRNKEKKLKIKLKNVAYLDSFTGLYNKNYLQEKIETNFMKKQGYNSALVSFDIMNFKMINKIYGVETGNYLIKKIAKILEENKIFKDDIIVRVIADRFLALYYYEKRENLEIQLKKIEKIIRKINYNGNNIFIKLYMGIYEINSYEKDFEKIFNYANIAKNKSKDLNSNFFTYYNEELAEKEAKEKKLESEIKEGILNKEFKAWFQPKFDCKTKEIVGCEALVRWYKKDGQVYFPNTFIGISEKNGLIKEIDKLVLEDVCININRWRKLGLKCPPVSINISRIYLNNMDIIFDLNKVISKYNISSKYIQLEITESSLVSSEDMLNKIINEMHKFGFKVLLDDFGVGYSSLHSINKLNFDTLKIDKSFVDNIGINNGDCILKHAIDLGKTLDMEVVVEGVETKEQYEFLKENGCDTIQGYYFSKPLDSKSFEELLKI